MTGGPKTLLVMCSGLGLGNSTRLLGVLQALRLDFRVTPEDLRVVVATNGRATAFWEAEGPALDASVLALAGYAPSRQTAARLRWRTFFRPSVVGAYLRNTASLFSFLAHRRTALALIDSDYHCLPLLFFRIPVLALGQAWDVLNRDEGNRPVSRLPRAGLLVERLDLMFQRLVSERILVPSFDTDVAAPPNVTPVPLIVRREYSFAAPPPSKGRLLVLLGGSGIGSAPLLAYAKRHGLSVIGAPGEPAASLDAFGSPLIDYAEAVLTQGGLSSLSECLARGKRMIVLPIEGHAEQLSNALAVEQLGMALRVSDLDAPPEEFIRRLERLGRGEAGETHWPRTDGAAVVAEILLHELGLARA